MPRTARKKSRSQIYHIMLRGINKQQIFFDQEDFRYFTWLLGRFRKTCGYQLYAYCLMGNHVHLLIREGEEVPIGEIFRHIGTAFVYWYNIKYERSGHLFQDRFRSEAVEDEGYLLTVFRYILMNPVKAGLCRRAEEYPYSSAGEYLKGRKGITDTEFLKERLAENMAEFIHQENEDQCMDMEEVVLRKVTDETAGRLIREEFGGEAPAAGKARERKALNESLTRLVRAGVSIRQLSRLTGLSKKVIENALKKETENRPLSPSEGGTRK